MTRFRILYENPSPSAEIPERYEEYDLVSAYYDYRPPGMRALIEIDGYRRELTDRVLIDFISAATQLATDIRFGRSASAEYVRPFVAGAPADAKLYYWFGGDVVGFAPMIIFAAASATTYVFTRTAREVSGLELYVRESDLPDPIPVPTAEVVAELRTFVGRYLDDMVASFPFIADDAVYQRERAALAELAP